ncbi:hypothetical protein ABZS66_34655 [Dactylosporangium sp. NPDC005572]|uniref:hypothetical protein n=1 Tax=Dactylosporangium sp. NPDC005572 TaxID=3156889 RepID=UPI0033B670C8
MSLILRCGTAVLTVAAWLAAVAFLTYSISNDIKPLVVLSLVVFLSVVIGVAKLPDWLGDGRSRPERERDPGLKPTRRTGTAWAVLGVGGVFLLLTGYTVVVGLRAEQVWGTIVAQRCLPDRKGNCLPECEVRGADDGRDLGWLDCNAGAPFVGETVAVLVDPDGVMPAELESKYGSGSGLLWADIAVIAAGTAAVGWVVWPGGEPRTERPGREPRPEQPRRVPTAGGRGRFRRRK